MSVSDSRLKGEAFRLMVLQEAREAEKVLL